MDIKINDQITFYSFKISLFKRKKVIDFDLEPKAKNGYWVYLSEVKNQKINIERTGNSLTVKSYLPFLKIALEKYNKLKYIE